MPIIALLNWWVARVNIVIAHETSNITCLLMSESTRYLALKSNPAFMQGSALKFVGRSGGHMNLQVIIQETHIGCIFTELNFFWTSSKIVPDEFTQFHNIWAVWWNHISTWAYLKVWRQTQDSQLQILISWLLQAPVTANLQNWVLQVKSQYSRVNSICKHY